MFLLAVLRPQVNVLYMLGQVALEHAPIFAMDARKIPRYATNLSNMPFQRRPISIAFQTIGALEGSIVVDTH